MKITRQQLRKLIETTIKPTIPNVPNEKMLGRIDDFARDPEMQADADSFAGAFGYPEDRSYVEDLKTYDKAGRGLFDTVYVKPLGQTEAEEVTIEIPYELIDKVVKAHEDLDEVEEFLEKMDVGPHFDRLYQIHQTELYAARNKLRGAGTDVFRHIHNHLDGKYGRDNYDVYSYGVHGAQGYRGDKYDKAMEKFGEVY